MLTNVGLCLDTHQFNDYTGIVQVWEEDYDVPLIKGRNSSVVEAALVNHHAYNQARNRGYRI